MRSLPFWLMMVSTATAVFPVWRSPMMSSRWPRPIGTIESITFRPVCTGWETDFLQITPGATFSMTSLARAAIGPLPSIGWPSEFTTRPRSSGPTGTSRMRPVHFTVSPSVICSYAPRITAPTVPCVRTSAESARLWILPRIRSLISDGLSCCMPGPLELVILRIHPSAFQRGGHVFQPAAHRGVDDFVADGDAHAPDQLLVQGDVRLHPALEAPLEVGDEARELRVVEPESRADLRLDHALVRVLQLQELRADLGEQREPVVRDQHAREIAQLHGQVLRARGHDQVVELLRAEPGIVDPGPHLRVRRDLRHGREHSLPLGERARFLGEAEYGLGVGPGDGRRFSHGYLSDQISRLSWLSSSEWARAFTSRRRIFSAPATASAATCSRSISLARATCWSMSALAAARMRSASAFAAAFASSSICASHFSAEPMISPTRSRALASSSCARLPAASSSRRPCSPAARPSAICFWRSSILPISHGQMNLTVSQMKSAKTRACAIKVRLMFIGTPRRPSCPARRAAGWRTRRTCRS